MRQDILTIEPWSRRDGLIELSAVLAGPGGPDLRLWFRVPASMADALAPTADPFVIAFAFPMMARGVDCHVKGCVSPRLLRGLEDYMHTWQAWRPESCRKVEITAEIETESASAPDAAIMCFSGGVDSCFTAWRHHHALAGRSTRNVTKAVFVHGFDIPLEMSDAFERARERNEGILADLGIALIPVTTNFRQFDVNWEDAHGTALVAALALFGGGFGTGLIASSLPYLSYGLRWGSTPWTDHLLSSDAMAIQHDGSEFLRLEKIRALTAWPAALRHLRVCWEGAEKHTNCCRCEKCVRDILAFRCLGVPLPPCFAMDVTDKQIRNLKWRGEAHDTAAQLLLDAALSAGFARESWVRSLRVALRRNRENSFLPWLRRKS